MSKEMDPQSSEANPYDSNALLPEQDNIPASSTESVPSASPVWLLPAVAIIVLMWAVIVIPGKLFPLTLIHFVSMQVGPIIGMVALGIWWLASRRLPMRQRLAGAILVFATVVATVMFSHRSATVITMAWGIPLSLTILVGLLALFRSTPWRSRRWIAYSGFAIFLVGTLFFRVGEMDASFEFDVVPRWKSTDESRFLAELSEELPADDAAIAPVTVPVEVSRGDWAEFRGPDRNSRLEGVTFAKDWKTNPPSEVWRRAVGPGWSSFCVVGPVVFTQEQRGEQEAVVAYRADDGELLWTSLSNGRFHASMGGVGPRATPTFHKGRLYVTDATGVIRCLEASSGETVWRYDFAEELDVEIPEWGFSGSPLVVDDLVIVFTAGMQDDGLVALDRTDGAVKWTGGDGSHSYCSPQRSIIDGRRQILYATSNGLQSIQVEDGKQLWAHEWSIRGLPRVTQPAVVGNTVYLGTGYGNGTRRLEVKETDDGWDVQSDWTTSLKPYFNDFVFHEGHLYGFDNNIFISIDGETGDRNWKGGRYGLGQVLLVADMGVLLVLSEKGRVILLEAGPEAHQEIASIDALDGVTWNHPVIAGDKLYVRNAREAACYKLPDFRAVAVDETLAETAEADQAGEGRP